MTQLEQELTALFEDATSRIDIRPAPIRSPRSVAINRVLAAGLTAALVAGVALIATRLGSDSANRGGAITPTATQTLLDAVARTMAQPVRLVTTFSSNLGTGQASVTELDVDRQELVRYLNGQPQMVIDGNRAYEAIPSGEREILHLPASAAWTAVSPPAGGTRELIQSVAGIVSAQRLAAAIDSGLVTVTPTAKNTYRLAGTQSGSAAAGTETLHIGSDGLLEWAKIRMDRDPTAPDGHSEVTVTVIPLDHSLSVPTPDPSTVISQRAYDAATSSGSGQSCSGGPSPAPSDTADGGPYTSTMHCSFGGSVTLHATKAKPPKR